MCIRDRFKDFPENQMTKFRAEFSNVMQNFVVEHSQLGVCGPKTGVLGGVKISLVVIDSVSILLLL